jgi:5-methylcytosine-specific restriction protein A
MSQKQDKQRIYNSKEWKLVRNAKLNKDPLCEECKRRDKWVSATCVHHIIPIETATDYHQMQELAFRFTNLMSLCYQCHSDIHKALNSRSREGHAKATQTALDRWAEAHRQKPYGEKADDYMDYIRIKADIEATEEGSDV